MKTNGFCFSVLYELTFLRFNKSFHLSSHKTQKETIVLNKSLCIISYVFITLKNVKKDFEISGEINIDGPK